MQIQHTLKECLWSCLLTLHSSFIKTFWISFWRVWVEKKGNRWSLESLLVCSFTNNTVNINLTLSVRVIFKFFTLSMISFKRYCSVFFSSWDFWWHVWLVELTGFPLLCWCLSDVGAEVTTAAVRRKNTKLFMLLSLVPVRSPGFEFSSLSAASVFYTSSLLL